MYEIEKGVPLPEPRGGYPFDEMEIGDSFSAPRKKANTLRGIACRKGVDGKKFVVRVEGDKVRVWRMACVAAFALTAALLTTTADAANEFKAVEPHSCARSLERWVEIHGRKTSGDPIFIGEPVRVTWDGGSINDVLLLPARNPQSGDPAVCVVMSRHVGRAE